jgi:hypothetical protein
MNWKYNHQLPNDTATIYVIMSQSDAVRVCKIFYSMPNNISKATCLNPELTVWHFLTRQIIHTLYMTWHQPEDFSLLRYIAVQSVENQQMFRSNTSPPTFLWNNKPSKESSMKQVACIALLLTCFMPESFLAYSSTLKMEGKFSSETSVVVHQPTRRYIPEDTTVHNHRCVHIISDTNVYCNTSSTKLIFDFVYRPSCNNVKIWN